MTDASITAITAAAAVSPTETRSFELVSPAQAAGLETVGVARIAPKVPAVESGELSPQRAALASMLDRGSSRSFIQSVTEALNGPNGVDMAAMAKMQVAALVYTQDTLMISTGVRTVNKSKDDLMNASKQ